MGNSIVSETSCWVTIMKLDGESIKVKAPVSVDQVVRDYPDHVVLDSNAVRHLGTKAKPLENSTKLQPRNLYFLLGMPKHENLRAPKRVRSDITMSAKSRLEAMMLARRSTSDITTTTSAFQCYSPPKSPETEGTIRVKVLMTKSQLIQLKAESNNSSDTAEKILNSVLNDGAAQKNVTATQNLTGEPPLTNISGVCKKAVRNRVRFSADV